MQEAQDPVKFIYTVTGATALTLLYFTTSISLARKIRAHNSRTRIIIASGHGNEQRLLQAVELGLTRFLPKPFGRRELKEALSKAVEELDVSPRLALSHTYRWDRQVRKLYRHEEEIKLTAKERELLTLLSSNPKQTFSPYTIETRLWPDAPHDTDLTARLKTLMKRLRKKLPPECIENSYGEGYRLRLNR